MKRLRFRFWLIATLFVMTGCAGLLAEQCFEKLLTRLVGASTPAAAVVLAVYFLGLTLGATLYRRAPRAAHPLRRYALLEGGVAFWSLGLLVSADALVALLVPLLRLGHDHFLLVQTLRGIVAVVWILPPTTLMGATFPAIVDVLEQWRIPRPRRAMSFFYSLNLAGAVLGALLGPYWAFPGWGLEGTLVFTFLVDATAAAAAWLTAAGLGARVRRRPDQPVSGSGDVVVPRTLLLLACVSGFLGFALEVLWTHLLSAVIGTSVYSFAAMLALVLIALGLGAALATLLFRENRPVSVTTVSLMLVATSALLAWQYRRWPDVSELFVVWGANLTRFEQGELLRWIQAGRLLLPPAIAMGMVYPSLFRTRLFPRSDRGRAAGTVGAWNSIGCVSGSLATAFLLLPTLGSEATLRLIGLTLVTASVLFVFFHGRGASRWGLLLLSIAVAVLWSREPPWNRLALTYGGHVNFARHMVGPGSELVFFHEDAQGITTVVRRRLPDGRLVRTLLTNGKFQADDYEEIPAQIGFALIPMLQVATPGEALVIGLGSGQSAAVVAGMGFRRVDIAEISSGIVRAAEAWFARVNHRILEDPRVTLHQEDGRNYLLLTERRYDLVTIELSNVWFAGATNLYSREFYALAREHLAPGGMLQQWIQFHHITPDEIGSVLATVHAVFPQVSLWVYGNQGIVVGSLERQRLQPWVVRRLAAENPWRAMGLYDARSEFRRLLSSRLLAPSDTARLLAATRPVVNTDWNRHLEYTTPRHYLERGRQPAENVRALAGFATFPGHELAGEWQVAERSWTEGLNADDYRAALHLDERPVTSAATRPPGP